MSPEAAYAIWSPRSGCTTAKVKVADPGTALADDLARVEAVRDALGPGGRIRVDANGAWDVDDGGRRASRELDRAAGGLEYVEQPCAAVEDLAAVRRRVAVPIAADESIRRAADPYRVRDLEAADIAVLKVQPLGGVRACLRIAEDIGMPVVVSSALETSLGLAAGVALAAALPTLDHACGLATRSLLTGDVASPELVPGRRDAAGHAARPSYPSAGDLGGRRPTGSRGGRTGWRPCGPYGRVVTRDVVDRARPRRGRPPGRERGPRDRARAGLAQRAAGVRGVRRRRGRRCSGCTPGSTSARPGSSPSG